MQIIFKSQKFCLKILFWIGIIFIIIQPFPVPYKSAPTHFFLIGNTFVTNVRLNLAKHKHKLSNILRLNLRYLKIICFLYPLYHPKIIADILKMYKKQVSLF